MNPFTVHQILAARADSALEIRLVGARQRTTELRLQAEKIVEAGGEPEIKPRSHERGHYEHSHPLTAITFTVGAKPAVTVAAVGRRLTILNPDLFNPNPLPRV